MTATAAPLALLLLLLLLLLLHYSPPSPATEHFLFIHQSRSLPKRLYLSPWNKRICRMGIAWNFGKGDSGPPPEIPMNWNVLDITRSVGMHVHWEGKDRLRARAKERGRDRVEEMKRVLVPT
ncbi:hypothetical protein BO86DRAFT_377925 [Aspergillus japonicus CBS 114.51]|uniref:Uncharacterized protein n=1 Tax=Aspergillus japonicus CBS 114.51 TaxID=1448312 RepID=A0A8T8X5A4_ASPJA|nr:hypothetical protein BO86DRAFT_377925 [Aspergillus japonicus CBS 114.51]RAH83338.1 hypothetical protein BO86DRAFT_377925 [Aspergillus japonicus CBS 114.51]